MNRSIVGISQRRLEVDVSGHEEATWYFTSNDVFLHEVSMSGFNLKEFFRQGQVVRIVGVGEDCQVHFGEVIGNKYQLMKSIDNYCRRYFVTSYGRETLKNRAETLFPDYENISSSEEENVSWYDEENIHPHDASRQVELQKEELRQEMLRLIPGIVDTCMAKIREELNKCRSNTANYQTKSSGSEDNDWDSDYMGDDLMRLWAPVANLEDVKTVVIDSSSSLNKDIIKGGKQNDFTEHPAATSNSDKVQHDLTSCEQYSYDAESYNGTVSTTSHDVSPQKEELRQEMLQLIPGIVDTCMAKIREELRNEMDEKKMIRQRDKFVKWWNSSRNDF